MPKILITNACQVNFGDDRGGVHADAGEFVDLPKDAASTLVNADRALYVDGKDDPAKDKRNTATEAMVKAAKTLATAKDKAATKAE